MKPFNIEAAKLGEPLITRDGETRVFIAHVPELSSEARIIVRREDILMTHCEDGRYYDNENECRHDLFMAPKKRTVWVNIHVDGYASYWETEWLADHHQANRLGNKAFPIEIEE